MNEEEKNLIRDTLHTPGWQILVNFNKEIVENYRKMATQEPNAVPQEMRTWFAGKAEGREELIQDVVDKVSTSLQE